MNQPDDVVRSAEPDLNISRPTRDAYYASFGRRFVAAFIDGLIVTVPNVVIALMLDRILRDPRAAAEGIEFIGNMISILITWLYFAVQESSSAQATLGKRALGIVVTDTEGQPLTFARATGRYVAKFLSGCFCGIGYLMAAFTENRQALHDIIAGTLVLRKDAVRG
jgi:uncharacterized RDD family membrane protein YckC